MEDLRGKVLSWLAALGDAGFAEVVREAAARRAQGADAEHFLLAQAGRSRDGAWALTAVAQPDPAHYPGGLAPDAPLAQLGTCRTCGVDVCSAAKRTLCPVCGGRVHCT